MGEKPMQKVVSYQITGMHCGSCASNVSKILEALPHIERAYVNMATEKAVVETSASGKKVAQKAKPELQKQGYDIKPIHGPFEHLLKIYRELNYDQAMWKYRAMFGGLLTLPILVLEMGSHLFGNHLSVETTIVLAVLAICVLVVSGGSFYKQSLREFMTLKFSMDSLIAVGSGAAFLYSMFNLILFAVGSSEMLTSHFESACLIVTLICSGRIVEKKQRKSAFAQIVKTINSIPKSANVIKDDEETSVTLEAVEKEDAIVVRAGETFPLDCEIIEGKADVDFSSITGESEAVLVEEKTTVPAGAICLNATVKAMVLRNNSESSVAQMIEQIENAQLDRSQTKQMIDRITGIFVPAIMILSVLVLIGHFLIGSPAVTAVMAMIAVLVIACPCALGIATPAALLSGSMLLSRHGVFLQDTSAFEKVNKLTDIFFDKTGTLTEGRSQVNECLVLDDDIKEEKVLSIAMTLEEGNRHPLGVSINEFAQSKDAKTMMAQDIEVIPGDGIKGSIIGKKYVIGSRHFIEDHCTIPDLYDDNSEKGTEVWLGIEGKEAIAVFKFRTSIRPNAKKLISVLQSDYEIHPWILSGDDQTVVKQVAKKIGVGAKHAKGQLKPKDKADIIEQLSDTGKICAFVGDGINDAPALSKADLAIAIEEGTEMAKAASHLKIHGHSIEDIVVAIDLLKTIRKKINQNLFFAFIYNVVLIPLAITGIIHPGLAAFAMAGSSITVVANAGLLSRYKPS